MSSLVETIIVAIIVAAALAGFIIRMRRRRRKGAACSSCAASGDCPLVDCDGSVLPLETLSAREDPQKPLQ